jgi:hypothetical protein
MNQAFYAHMNNKKKMTKKKKKKRNCYYKSPPYNEYILIKIYLKKKVNLMIDKDYKSSNQKKLMNEN